MLSRQGIIPQQHSMCVCLGEAGGRAWVAVSEKVTKAVRSMKRRDRRARARRELDLFQRNHRLQRTLTTLQSNRWASMTNCAPRRCN